MISKTDLLERIKELEHRQRLQDINRKNLEYDVSYLRRINNALLDELGYEPVVVEKHTKLEKKDERD